MADNESKEQLNAENDDKVLMNDGKKRSMVDTIREISERERREALEEESRKAQLHTEKEREERNQYAKKLAEDRIELMKLKAGIISEEEIPKEQTTTREYSTWDKISNFFYHNKAYIIIITLIAIVAAFLIYDIATNKKPDVAVMILASDDEFNYRTTQIQQLLEQYCEDYNGDGKVFVRVSYLPAVVDTSDGSTGLYYSQSDQTKLVAEFQSVDSIIVIADDYTCETVKIEQGVLADLRDVYADDENATKLGYMLSGTSFAEDIKYTAMADNLFIGFRYPDGGYTDKQREKFRVNYENALTLWDNYLNGNVINKTAEEN